MAAHTIYLVGGAPRVGKSTLAYRLLREGIPWLPTDVIRTVLRRVLPQLDALDEGLVDATLVADFMYPHIEQAAEVCAEEHETFLIEGFDVAPSFCTRLSAALKPTEIRGCFLGHGTFTLSDLASYHGPKPQHEDTMPSGELGAAASWIRERSHQLRAECSKASVPYVDIGEQGFEAGMSRARHHLLG